MFCSYLYLQPLDASTDSMEYTPDQTNISEIQSEIDELKEVLGEAAN